MMNFGSTQKVRVDWSDKIPVVTMANEKQRNAFDEEMVDLFVRTLAELELRQPRAAVLCGEGTSSFCAGLEKGLAFDKDFGTRLDELRKRAFLSEDLLEGLAAFKERRPPRFEGK